MGFSTTESATCRDAADVVDGVVQSSHDTTVGRMGELDNIDRSSCGGYTDAESEEETTTEKLSEGGRQERCTFDDGADDEQAATDEHSPAPAPGIRKRANERQRAHSADGIHGRDIPGLHSHDPGPKFILIGRQDKHVAHETTIIPVLAGAEVGRCADDVELDHAFVERLRRLSRHCGLEGLVSHDRDFMEAPAVRRECGLECGLLDMVCGIGLSHGVVTHHRG